MDIENPGINYYGPHCRTMQIDFFCAETGHLAFICVAFNGIYKKGKFLKFYENEKRKYEESQGIRV